MWDLETGELIKHSGYEYDLGQSPKLCISMLPTALGAGASLVGGLMSGSGVDPSTAAAQKSDAQFQQTMANEQQTQFANEQDAQNQLKTAWDPIIKGGEYQQGFSTGENANLVSGIENTGATATTNTENAALLREQQASGGAQTMPTGASAAINAQVAETGAQKTAEQLNQEQEQNYATGRENFLNATKGEATIASLADPNAYAKSTNAAEGNVLDANKVAAQEQAQGMGQKLLGGAITGGLGLLNQWKPGSGGSGGNSPNTNGAFFPGGTST